MAVGFVSTGVQFPDTTIQTTAAAAAVPQMQVFTAPGTFSIPPSTTRVKVTVIGGGGGSPGFPSGAGSSGQTSSFGSYASATGGSVSAPGTSPGSQLDAPLNYFGKFGSGPTFGGYGTTTISAPFPVTSVPVTVGAGGAGGGGFGGAASGINGGAGVRPGGPTGGPGGGGGGGASGVSAPYQGAGGAAAPFIAGLPTQAGQPGAGPFNRFGGGLGGSGIESGDSANPGYPGGTGAFQGMVIVEY